MNKYYCKMHNSINGLVVGVCDDYLLETYLFEKENSKISETFYGNKIIDENELISKIENNLENINSINFMGKNSVNVAKQIFQEIIIFEIGNKKIPHSIIVFSNI